MKKLTSRRVFGLFLIIVGVTYATWLSVQEFRTFFVEDRGIEFFRSNPIMIAVCLAIGLLVGLVAHLALDYKNRNRNGAIPPTSKGENR